MDAALIEKLRDIPDEEIQRVTQANGYSRWSYFTDTEAAQAGVIYAGDDSLAVYYPGRDSALGLGPSGKMELGSIQYVPSSHQLYIENSGKYLTLQVFSDLNTAGHDSTSAQEWQQFLADHGVRKMTAPSAGRSGSAATYKKLAAVAAVALIAATTLLIIR